MAAHGGKPRSNNGMITRYFDHPNGGRATLEIPQGWAKTCFFRLTIYDANGKPIGEPEIGSYNTPAEARTAAMVREQGALSAGWRPRMAANVGQSGEEVALFTEDGRPIACRVMHCVIDEIPTKWWDGTGHKRPEQRSIVLLVRGLHDMEVLNNGGKVLVRHQMRDISNIQLMIVTMWNMHAPNHGGESSYEIKGHIIPLEDKDYGALIDEATKRESIIAAFVNDTAHWTFQSLWNQIGLKDPAEKTSVVNEILKRRTERDDRQRREAEIAAQRQRDFEMQREQSRRFQEQERLFRQGLLPVGPAKPSADTMRKLSGGKEIGKPKPRKIDLGD